MGWFFITIALPLVAPIFLILQYKWLPIPPENAKLARFIAPVKDGQLCWAVIGFCSSAMYEMAVPGKDGRPIDGTYAGWIQAGFVILLVASSSIAAAGAVFPTDIGAPLGKPWYRHYSAFVVSLALTGLAGGAYTVVHFHLTSL